MIAMGLSASAFAHDHFADVKLTAQIDRACASFCSAMAISVKKRFQFPVSLPSGAAACGFNFANGSELPFARPVLHIQSC